MRFLRPPAVTGRTDRIGVLLVNTGTPDSLAVRDVRRYLAAFLGDPRVIEAPRLVWQAVLQGWILRTRPRASARKYRKIWTPEGSPLLVLSRQLQAALGDELTRAGLSECSVEIAMLYSQPSVPQALQRLTQAGCGRILVLPLYPQYCGASTAAVYDQVQRTLSRWRRVPDLRLVADYHDDPLYIEALRSNLQRHWAQQGRPPHLLMSFHGIPQSYCDRGDPYADQCRTTARLLAQSLQLTDDQWTLSFQSRLGPTRWLQPYTLDTVGKLPARGIRELGVVCPGFAIDCLETLEEIQMENRDAFLEAGGTAFSYVPALNASADHTAFLAGLIGRQTQGWR